MVMTREVEKISGSLSISSEHPWSHSIPWKKNGVVGYKIFCYFCEKNKLILEQLS